MERVFSSSRTLTLAERYQERSLLPPRGMFLIYVCTDFANISGGTGTDVVVLRNNINIKEVNSALSYYCHFGDVMDDRLRAVLLFLVNVVKEPAFGQLRTVEQLGYATITLPVVRGAEEYCRHLYPDILSPRVFVPLRALWGWISRFRASSRRLWLKAV